MQHGPKQLSKCFVIFRLLAINCGVKGKFLFFSFFSKLYFFFRRILLGHKIKTKCIELDRILNINCEVLGRGPPLPNPNPDLTLFYAKRFLSIHVFWLGKSMGIPEKFRYFSNFAFFFMYVSSSRVYRQRFIYTIVVSCHSLFFVF